MLALPVKAVVNMQLNCSAGEVLTCACRLV